MIDYQILRQLVFEALRLEACNHFLKILRKVEELGASRNLFPTKEECQRQKINYIRYSQGRLNEIDELNVNQIIWDLIIDRVLAIGTDTSNLELPWIRLTEFGQTVLDQATPTHYDPEGYAKNLEGLVPNIDSVIKQYITEGLNCFRQRLFFAAAVMFGAAAEKAILLLLESIGNAKIDKKKKETILKLLERSSLPKIFSTIQSELTLLIKAGKIPYSIHQGSTEYLLSLFEMIRVQRNDAVHPTVGQVNKTKVFLTIQSLPPALEVIYRLIKWFTKNEI